jgi:ubiquinone/menaquinone biosynthesis C-methylase UbiE
MSHKEYYKDNLEYSFFIDTQNHHIFDKYVRIISEYSKDNGSVLDVGCGTGIALSKLADSLPHAKTFGIDISNTSIEIAKQRNLNVKGYDGIKISFDDLFFDTVGSYNVLEHTDNPVMFLEEKLRVLKRGGVLIVACPNFLSITNGFHSNTRGVYQKFKNLFGLIEKLLFTEVKFKKMQTISRHPIHPDDDACNVTNPLDIQAWAASKGLKTLLWSSQSIERIGLISRLDCYWLRLILGSCFFVFRKP